MPSTTACEPCWDYRPALLLAHDTPRLHRTQNPRRVLPLVDQQRERPLTDRRIGVIENQPRSASRSSRSAEFAWRSAVVVFPTARGPVMNSAGQPPRCCAKTPSAMRAV